MATDAEAHAAAPEEIEGYLVLVVEEASGRSSSDVFVWESFAPAGQATLEAFVKVELRGGIRNVKVQTRKSKLESETILWQEELRIEVPKGANELRLMLCRERDLAAGKKGTQVMAACGIFVSDIVDAVPIDKYFELFKPGGGGEGGYIRINMNYVKDLKELDNKAAVEAPDSELNAAQAAAKQATKQKKKSNAKGALTVLLALGIAAAGAVAGIAAAKRRH